MKFLSLAATVLLLATPETSATQLRSRSSASHAQIAARSLVSAIHKQAVESRVQFDLMQEI